MGNRKIIITKDGTTTIQLTHENEHYHSTHGALSEANHVYIKSGLDVVVKNHHKNSIHILEVGFGTGLNSLLTFLAHKKLNCKVYYTGLESFPVSMEELNQLNYHHQLGIEQADFLKLHQTPWNEFCTISENFYLKKWEEKLEDVSFKNTYDLVYFDAFGFRTHPEIWHISMLKKISECMNKDAVFVTYSVMGQVRRDLIACGLIAEKIEGPPGKREMLRAIKP